MSIKSYKILNKITAKSKSFILALYSKRLRKNYDIKNTIVIAGVPRGGTTWLYEILLNTIPFAFGIWEPLALYRDVRLKELNFLWRQYIDPKHEWKEAEALLKDILTGRNMNLSQISNYSVLKYFESIKKTDTYIVKFCRANRLLKWLTDRFHTCPPILLIRHPCAVVASQLRHGAWDHSLKNKKYKDLDMNSAFLTKEPWVAEIIKDINTPEEKLALTWCLDNYLPLSEPKPYPWVLTTYEKLVTDGGNEIKRIFKSISREVPKDVDRYLRKPSTSTMNYSNVAKGGDRLATWKRLLNNDQQDRILSMVSKFGLDFYTDELEPDYERLYHNRLQRIK